MEISSLRLNILLLAALFVLFAAPVHAQTVNYVVFVLDNTLYAHALHGADLRVLSPMYPGLENTLPQTTDSTNQVQRSPVQPDERFGFYQGIWSPDRRQFVYIQIQFPVYQLKLYSEDQSKILLESEISAQRGYLVPLGWKRDGGILLLERYMLYNLKNAVRIWQINPRDGELKPYANTSIAQLHGQSMTLGERAFLGFDVENHLGYWFDFESGQFSTFESALTFPESSVFEVFPVRILGIVTSSELVELLNQLTSSTAVPPVYPAAFLYWPLPTSERQVTCYPDSPFTQARHEITCPALGREYPGHEGTDIGSLPLDTPVYAAAPGIVVDINSDCGTDNPSCGRAYGNYITLEHSLAVDGAIQTWYTGYAHLNNVSVTPWEIIADLALPIGTSGSTGEGGPHLHFEVRYPHQNGPERWVDPWGEPSLWLGGSAMPTASK